MSESTQPRPNSPEARDIASVIHPLTNLKAHLEKGPVVVAEGDGVWVTDIHGKKYIEGMSGLWCISLGYGQERLVEAAADQMRRLPYYHLTNHKSHSPVIELAEKHECIGDVRGVGHFWGLELVKNRETREPFNVKAQKFDGTPLVTGKVAAEAMANGLFMFAWYDNLIITPPLIITEEQVDEGIAILDKALEIADAEVESTGASYCRSSNYTK